MLPALMRLVFYTILAYFVLKVFRFFQTFSNKSIPKAERPSKNLSGVMVKDEVCQTYLPKDDAIRDLKEGEEYYFCSKECRSKFLQKNE